MVQSGQGLRGTDVLFDPPPCADHRHEVGQAGGGGAVAAVKGQLAGVAVAADEVYGGHDLRSRIRELGYDYAVAVPASHRVTTPAGRFTATSLLARLPRKAWQRLRAGHGTKGDRHYDWAMIEADPDDTPWGA